jgi:ABC-2 type transport system permease protein
LLPVSNLQLLIPVICARFVIVASAVALQIALARILYGTPLPVHVFGLVVAFGCVMVAFTGLGLVVAALADDVPAVQALGQCLFLPMIMIGGVGIPLAVLPVWAQRIAGFMPGRYAVEALQACITGQSGLVEARFDLVALIAIGVAAGFIGGRFFRWESAEPSRRLPLPWLGAALLTWGIVGAMAAGLGHLKPVIPEAAAWETISDEQIARITFQGLPGDGELVTRLARPFGQATRPAALQRFSERLETWRPGHLDNAGQSIRNLVCVAAIADLCQDPLEGEMAREVFDQLRREFSEPDLRRGLAWLILSPDEGDVIRKAPELGLPRHPPERIIRLRCSLYAQKFLGRIVGNIAEPAANEGAAAKHE